MARGFRDPARKQNNLFERAVREARPEEADDIMRGAASEEEKPHTVSEITRSIKQLLEGRIGRVWVEGEISNLSRPRSGHIYFTLKDEHAAIGVVMWRSAASRLRSEISDGMRVTVRGSISVYEPQGRYQIVADSLRPVGRGDLQRRYEELVAKLSEEGLFDPATKRELPALPRTVGIVTSPTGAAIRDMLRVLRRRLPSVKIIVSPCPVQGEKATPEIVSALERLDSSGLCDVIIIGRGGGSLEDLWCFNEEAVARAVYATATPIVSAVGHETDFSICDMVADYRAATPSEGAEEVVPDITELRKMLAGQAVRLTNAVAGHLREARLSLNGLAARPVLRDPMAFIGMPAQRVDENSMRLQRALNNLLTSSRHNFANLAQRSLWRDPVRLLRPARESLTRTNTALDKVAKSFIDKRRERVGQAAAGLQALSPLAVMARGYSLTYDPEKQRLVRNAQEVTIGMELETRLHSGKLRSTVTAIDSDGSHHPQEQSPE